MVSSVLYELARYPSATLQEFPYKASRGLTHRLSRSLCRVIPPAAAAAQDRHYSADIPRAKWTE